MSGLSVPTAYYAADVASFLGDTTESVLGSLTVKSAFAVDPARRDAWIEEVHVLKAALEDVEGTILLEFDVPRIGSRLDAVLVTGPTVFVIEFKVGEREFKTADRNQTWDYALDLKNFHKASHIAPIVPILVATEAADGDPHLLDPASDGVYPPVVCSARRLGDAIRLGIERTAGAPLDAIAWAHAPYEPTPTIIEAAQARTPIIQSTPSRAATLAPNLGITSLRVKRSSTRRGVRAGRLSSSSPACLAPEDLGRPTSRPRSAMCSDTRRVPLETPVGQSA